MEHAGDGRVQLTPSRALPAPLAAFALPHRQRHIQSTTLTQPLSPSIERRCSLALLLTAYGLETGRKRQAEYVPIHRCARLFDIDLLRDAIHDPPLSYCRAFFSWHFETR